ncbi:hypothetical protein [Nocardia harenae]|uniref:hypothetical protein n=1 Tax=Nocardia harenae TaxID=358707 RepID=UPI000A6475B1|nr:hypothetical protein [Nocardia harenae]
MGSEGDARGSDSGRGAGFGPPVDGSDGAGENGVGASGFGPPVAGGQDEPTTRSGSAFGAPIGPGHIPGWQPPAGSRPEVGWRPAGGLLPAGGSTDAAPPPAGMSAPFGTSVTGADPEPPTVRHQVAPASAPARTPAPAAPAQPDAEPPQWWNQSDEAGGVPKPPPVADGGLAWNDDPIARRLAPGGSAVAERVPAPNRGTLYGALAAAVALLIAVVVIVVTVRGGGDDDPAVAAPVPSTAALSCPASEDGTVTVGNGTGSTEDGAGAILGFQYAFYVERNGERARRYVDPDAANISSAQVIQSAIDEQIPVGTTHCLRVTELATDTFEVDLTEHRPDGATTVYQQTVATVVKDGRHLVHSIDNRP